MNGCIMSGDADDEDQALAAAREFPGLNGVDLAKVVSTREELCLERSCYFPGNAACCAYTTR